MTLNRDIVRPIVELNRGPQAAYPRLVIGRPEEVDVALLAESLSKLVPLGLKVRAAEVRSKVGLSEPEADDELLTPPDAAAPAGDDTARAAAEPAEPADSISQLMAEVDGWAPMLEPALAALDQLAGKAEDLEAFREQLAEAVGHMDLGELEELLVRAGFAARLAGHTGAPITQDD